MEPKINLEAFETLVVHLEWLLDNEPSKTNDLANAQPLG